MKNTTTIACIALLFSCISNQIISQEPLEAPSDSSAKYFPLAASREDTTNNALHDFTNTWYSRMLFALHEPLLNNYSGVREIYRFTWLRTFHHPIGIRLEKEGDQHRLIVKMTSGAGGYEPGKLIIDKVITITPLQWTTFLEKMKKLDFWNVNTKEDKFDRGMDGSEWILEGCANKEYHVVIRWTPGKGKFRDCADYLVELSGLNIPEKTYY